MLLLSFVIILQSCCSPIYFVHAGTKPRFLCEAFRKDLPIYDKRGRHIDSVSCESNSVNDQNCQVQLVYDGSTIKKTGSYQNNWIV